MLTVSFRAANSTSQPFWRRLIGGLNFQSDPAIDPTLAAAMRGLSSRELQDMGLHEAAMDSCNTPVGADALSETHLRMGRDTTL